MGNMYEDSIRWIKQDTMNDQARGRTWIRFALNHKLLGVAFHSLTQETQHTRYQPRYCDCHPPPPFTPPIHYVFLPFDGCHSQPMPLLLFSWYCLLCNSKFYEEFAILRREDDLLIYLAMMVRLPPLPLGAYPKYQLLTLWWWVFTFNKDGLSLIDFALCLSDKDRALASIAKIPPKPFSVTSSPARAPSTSHPATPSGKSSTTTPGSQKKKGKRKTRYVTIEESY